MASSSSSVASRSDRHYQVDPNDVATQRALAFSAWLKRNRQMVLAAAAVAAVLVIGTIYYSWSRANARAEASAAYMAVQQQAEQAGNPAAAVRPLSNFIAAHDGTPEAVEARLALGEIHLRNNEPQKAIPVLQPVAGEGTHLGTQAAILLASAQARAGQGPAAIATLTAAADRAELDYMRNEALGEAALLHEQAGNWRGAAEIYRRLVDGAEKGSMDRSINEMRLAEAEARAGGR
jgi:predicted negative regulator of RcsB-dependent stress response